MGYFKDKAMSLTLDHIKSTYTPITVKPGKCRFNFRCHNNAVHEAVRRGDEHIAMVMYVENGCSITHFINCKMNKLGQYKYVDNTLGVWSSQYDYYLVGYIDKSRFFGVYDYHRKQMQTMRSILPWYIKMFTDFRT